MSESLIEVNRKFLSVAYWISGAISFTWMTGVAIGAARYYTPINLPIVGSCTTSEAIIFTLMVGWIPVLGTHLAAHGFRQTLGEDQNPIDKLPGQIDELTIPSFLRWLRLLMFCALICMPTALYLSLTVKAGMELRVVPKDASAAGVIDQLWPTDPLYAESLAYEISGWQELLSPWKGPADNVKKIEWRWRHQYTEFREALMAHKFELLNYSHPKLKQFPVLTSAHPFQPYLFLIINAFLLCSLMRFFLCFFVHKKKDLKKALIVAKQWTVESSYLRGAIFSIKEKLMAAIGKIQIWITRD